MESEPGVKQVMSAAGGAASGSHEDDVAGAPRELHEILAAADEARNEVARALHAVRVDAGRL